MEKKINNKKLFKSVLENFKNHINENGNGFKELENFHNKIEWKTIEDTEFSLKRTHKYIENKALKELSKDIVKNYENIQLIDIYNLIPEILRKINCFIGFDSKNINVDYYYILSSYINITPENKKPNFFGDFEKNLDFYEEIIFKTLDNADEIYKNFEFNFTFKIPFEIVSNKEEINIGDRIKIYYTDDNILEIKGNYKKGYILEKFHNAFKDLTLIINILELNNIFIIKDINKAFGKYSECHSCKEYEINNFEHSKTIDNQYGLNISYFKKHLEKFNYSIIGDINLKYFYLLSEKVKNTNLIIASYFFGTELKRFDSQIFLSYWQSIEIMLGSPEKNIKEELKNKFKLFFPNDNNSIDILWENRCNIVHNGKLDVDDKDLKTVKSISKQLFLKLLVSNYF